MIPSSLSKAADRLGARAMREGVDALSDTEIGYLSSIVYVRTVLMDDDFGVLFHAGIPGEVVVEAFEQIGHAPAAATAALAHRIFKIDPWSPDLSVLGAALRRMEPSIAARLRAVQREHQF